MRQVTGKEWKKFVRGTNIELFKELTQASPLRSVYEWRDDTNTAHARVVYIYAAAGGSETSDTIYEIED